MAVAGVATAMGGELLTGLAGSRGFFVISISPSSRWTRNPPIFNYLKSVPEVLTSDRADKW